MFKILLSKSNILNINLDPPVIVEDRQLVVLAAHVAATMRSLTNAQRRGQPTVAKAEAVRGQTTINQKWQQRCSKFYFKCNILNITWLRRKEQGAAVCGRDDSCNGVGSQQWQARAQATVAEAEAAKGQTTINQKAVAIAAESVLVAAETAAAVAVAAAMTTAAMVATTRQPWQR